MLCWGGGEFIYLVWECFGYFSNLFSERHVYHLFEAVLGAEVGLLFVNDFVEFLGLLEKERLGYTESFL